MIRAFVVAAALAAPLASPAACDIAYSFRADWSGPAKRFASEMSFDAGGRTETPLRVVKEWGGVEDFHAGIRDLHGLGEGTEVVATDEPNRWIVRHAPTGRVRIAYDVVNRRPEVDGGKGLNHRDFYRNALGATWFHLFGHAILLQSERQRDSEPLDACLEFAALPTEWRFASNRTAGAIDGVAHWEGRASPQQLRSSVFLGGDFRVYRREVAGRPIWVALRGTWKFSDDAFADATQRLIETQRRFWNDPDFPHYLVALSPNELPQGSYGGTALHDAFAMHAARDTTIPGRAFDFLLAHEHLHTWIPRRIGTMGMETESSRYWFSEGFTDYMTHRLQLRAGFWTLEDYANAVNQVLEAYWTSSARESKNADVARAFWTDPAAGRIPYQRGELFALHLSRRLAQRGADLDTVLRSLALPAGGVPRESDRRESDLAVERFRSAMRDRLGDSYDADVESLITQGGMPKVDADFLGPCYSGSWVDRPRFELGFDRSSIAARKVSGLVSGSAAERAGLREGMALAGWSVYFGDTTRDATIQVRGDDGVVRDFRYRPVAENPVRLPHFALSPGASESAACKAWRGEDFSGTASPRAAAGG